MAHDEKKWVNPATGGEVAGAILDCRLAMIQLFAMIVAVKTGSQEQFAEAEKKYVALDTSLRKAIDAIGGLNAVPD